MAIRRATNADLQLMERLWDAFSVEASFAPYGPSPFESSLVSDHVALVAEDDGTAVGTVYANLASPGFGFVFGLYVVPEARRKGVARELMRAIARVAREARKSHVVLNVDTPNATARSFYASLGFEDAARTLRAEVGQLLDGRD